MNYSEFKMYLISDISDKVGCDAEVSVRKVRKNNGVILDGLTVHGTGRNIAPTIYLNRYWDAYQDGTDLDDICESIIAENEMYTVERNIDIDQFLDFERVREEVMFRIVNYEMNRDLFDTVPAHKVMDLAAVYYYEVRGNDLPGATYLIRNEDLRRWNVTEEELWLLALENTPRKKPLRIRTLRETMEDLCAMDLCPADITDSDMMDILSFTGKAPMHILTNVTQIFGASCLLYPETMGILADMFGRDLYILPSSIHEVILMPVEESYDTDELSEMVREINEKEVLPHEVLSDHVYRYDAEKKEMSIS